MHTGQLPLLGAPRGGPGVDGGGHEARGEAAGRHHHPAGAQGHGVLHPREGPRRRTSGHARLLACLHVVCPARPARPARPPSHRRLIPLLPPPPPNRSSSTTERWASTAPVGASASWRSSTTPSAPPPSRPRRPARSGPSTSAPSAAPWPRPRHPRPWPASSSSARCPCSAT